MPRARISRSTRMLRYIDLRRTSVALHQSRGSAASIISTFGWHNRQAQAFNAPAELDVYPINAVGSLGAKIEQQAPINPGIYVHQVRVAPSGHTVILATRGNDGTSTTPEDPGALKIFEFHNGQLSNEQSVAPHNGYGFGPRHLDFHPKLPLVYVSMERENQLQVFSLKNGIFSSTPIFSEQPLLIPRNSPGISLRGGH